MWIKHMNKSNLLEIKNKMRNNSTISKEGDNKWGDVMKFLEKNPGVLMNIIPDEINGLKIPTERKYQGAINYRSITGIAPPRKAKNQQSKKQDDMLIAPWKMKPKNKILNQDIKASVEK